MLSFGSVFPTSHDNTYMRDLSDPEEQAERRTGIRRSQTEILSLQSDKDRLVRKQNELAMEIRRLKGDLSRLKMDLEEKTASEQALAKEIALIDEEINHAKKHMNSL